VNNGPTKGADPDTMKTLLSSKDIETVWQLHRNLTAPGALNTKGQFIANEKTECSAQFIKTAVQPDGVFSVRIGRSGVETAYAPR
jgi:hypothetical protein